MNPVGTSTIEQFERAIVFRSARLLPLVLSVLTTLLLTIALVALLYSVVPSLKPSQPKPVPQPPQVSVNSADVSNYLNRSEQPVAPSQPASGQVQSSQPIQPAPISPNAQSLANEMGKLRAQATNLNVPWANQYKTVCSQVIFGNCWGQREVLAEHGVGGYMQRAVDHHNDPGSQTETVAIDGQTYVVNPSQYEVKLAILHEMQGVLASAHAEDAHKILAAWGRLREQKEGEREASIRAEQDKRAAAYAKAQSEYEETVDRKHTVRAASLGAIGYALGAFVLLGLVLAVLAVERHTRLLESQIRSANEQSLQPPVHV